MLSYITNACYILLNITLLFFGIALFLPAYFEGYLPLNSYGTGYAVVAILILPMLFVALIIILVVLCGIFFAVYRKPFFAQWHLKLLGLCIFSVLLLIGARACTTNATLAYIGFSHSCKGKFTNVKSGDIELWCKELGADYSTYKTEESIKELPQFFRDVNVQDVEISSDQKTVELYWGGGFVPGFIVFLTTSDSLQEDQFPSRTLTRVNDNVYFWSAHEWLE